MMEKDEKQPKVKLPEGIKDIKDIAYITSRKLKNANGEKTGAVVMWRNKGEDEFRYTLKCPYCGAEEESSTMLKRRPYRVRCSNCGMSILTDKESLASIGSRLVSFVVDLIILDIALTFGFVFLSRDSFTLIFYWGLITMGYFTYFFGNGQTLGMKVVKIKLIGTDGTYPVGYIKGFLRWIGMVISNLIFNLGYLWILIDKNRQGWHDGIAGTYVIVA